MTPQVPTHRSENRLLLSSDRLSSDLRSCGRSSPASSGTVAVAEETLRIIDPQKRFPSWIVSSASAVMALQILLSAPVSPPSWLDRAGIGGGSSSGTVGSDELLLPLPLVRAARTAPRLRPPNAPRTDAPADVVDDSAYAAAFSPSTAAVCAAPLALASGSGACDGGDVAPRPCCNASSRAIDVHRERSTASACSCVASSVLRQLALRLCIRAPCACAALPMQAQAVPRPTTVWSGGQLCTHGPPPLRNVPCRRSLTRRSRIAIVRSKSACLFCFVVSTATLLGAAVANSGRTCCLACCASAGAATHFSASVSATVGTAGGVAVPSRSRESAAALVAELTSMDMRRWSKRRRLGLPLPSAYTLGALAGE